MRATPGSEGRDLVPAERNFVPREPDLVGSVRERGPLRAAAVGGSETAPRGDAGVRTPDLQHWEESYTDALYVSD